KVDFSCFGYHPDLESRLTFQEKWVLASAARDTSWTGASASSIDQWQPPIDMGRSLSALSISPRPAARLSNDED
ncbi:hypothetical protein, partial [Bradyrhizobium liaoningense]